jgi:hypothetical protein
MAGHSRSKNGVALLAYVPGIHVWQQRKNVDARHKAGHDAVEARTTRGTYGKSSVHADGFARRASA